jgi:hypothetical protein
MPPAPPSLQPGQALLEALLSPNPGAPTARHSTHTHQELRVLLEHLVHVEGADAQHAVQVDLRVDALDDLHRLVDVLQGQQTRRRRQAGLSMARAGRADGTPLPAHRIRCAQRHTAARRSQPAAVKAAQLQAKSSSSMSSMSS